MLNRWLSRLSYSFIIIALVLGFEIYRVRSGQVIVPAWQYTLMCVAAVLSLGLGIMGVRARHRIKQGADLDDRP